METGSSQAAVPPVPTLEQAARRRLMVRDALKFLTLTAVVVVLSGVTTFLFRSFESRREQLAVLWSQRGRDAMQAGRSAAAVTAMRVSLSYHPDDYDNQLALAEALAASGHVNEAESYFLNLSQSRPGDGPINLQLARLERSRGHAQQATEYYRAAVFGTWAGDAPDRRRDTRLELANYLVERGQSQAAQAELLVAAGNNPDPVTQLLIGKALESAGDTKGAVMAYRNAEKGSQSEVAAAHIGELCYRAGDYVCADDSLEKALRFKGWTADQIARMSGQQQDASKLQELAFSPAVPASLRSVHLLHDAAIAQMRLTACADPAMLPLQDRWKALDTAHNRVALRHDDDLQDQYKTLIFDTEASAAQACGAPSGDDALLVYLKEHPMIHIGVQ